jgi:hypothetical protein
LQVLEAMQLRIRVLDIYHKIYLEIKLQFLVGKILLFHVQGYQLIKGLEEFIFKTLIKVLLYDQ